MQCLNIITSAPRFHCIICDKKLKCNQQDKKDVKGHIDIPNHKSRAAARKNQTKHKSPVNTSERIMFKYGVSSGPYFPVFSPNTAKYGPEKTPHLDNFHAVDICRIKSIFRLTCYLKVPFSIGFVDK